MLEPNSPEREHRYVWVYSESGEEAVYAVAYRQGPEEPNFWYVPRAHDFPIHQRYLFESEEEALINILPILSARATTALQELDKAVARIDTIRAREGLR